MSDKPAPFCISAFTLSITNEGSRLRADITASEDGHLLLSALVHDRAAAVRILAEAVPYYTGECPHHPCPPHRFR